MIVGFGMLFFAVGGGLATSAIVRWRLRANAYRNGLVSVGRIVEVTRDYSTKVNGKSPWLIEVAFEANGLPIQASKSIMGRLEYGVGQEVHVIYSPQKPERFVLYPM